MSEQIWIIIQLASDNDTENLLLLLHRYGHIYPLGIDIADNDQIKWVLKWLNNVFKVSKPLLWHNNMVDNDNSKSVPIANEIYMSLLLRFL